MTPKKHDLYRLPWSKNDNPTIWLEVTDICNFHCEGCYRQRLTGHKPLEEIKEEIRFLKHWRNPDSASIAGGEPLLHPQIVDIVAFIAENGIKPILLTNAYTLTVDFLRELKRAGLAGLTVHIDSHQGRPGWTGKDEAEHNELRQYYADMVASVGGIIMFFNSTVYPSTFSEVPDVVRWAQANIDRVAGLAFITYRTVATDENAVLNQAGEEVNAACLGYTCDHLDENLVTSLDVYRIIRENCPAYDACAYLGGTVRHDSFKWLVATTVGSRHGMYGSLGKTIAEVAQVGHHLFQGTYFAYLSNSKVSPLFLLMLPWDKALRQTMRNWLADVLHHPTRLFSGLRMQAIGIIQAPDTQTKGQLDMCESCPDMTAWGGMLVNSCRMDEYRLFGDLLSTAERQKARVAVESIAPGKEENA